MGNAGRKPWVLMLVTRALNASPFTVGNSRANGWGSVGADACPDACFAFALRFAAIVKSLSTLALRGARAVSSAAIRFGNRRAPPFCRPTSGPGAAPSPLEMGLVYMPVNHY